MSESLTRQKSKAPLFVCAAMALCCVGVFLAQHFHQEHDISEDERVGIDKNPLIGGKAGELKTVPHGGHCLDDKLS